jgi:hypothetical protein
MKKLAFILFFLSLYSINASATAYQPTDLEVDLNKRLVDAWLEIEYQGFEDIRSIKNMSFHSATKDADGGYTFILKADVRSSGLTGAGGGDDWWLEE